MKYINLSCELNRQGDIRDSLIGYRNLTQANNSDSLKVVLEHYLKIMKEKFSKKMSQYKLESKEIQDTIKDIDQEDQPEEILIVSFNDENKNRKNEIKLIMKQLWDTYKCIYETVKTNKMLYKFQLEIIEKAVLFCKEYQRINELKRFIENCKRNLQDLIKPNQKYKLIESYIDMHTPEINEAFIESRLKIYDILYEMKLFQECYKVLEDVLAIFNCRHKKFSYKQTIKSKFYFYKKLSEIFLYLQFINHHAFFLLNQYIMIKQKKTATVEERTSLIDNTIIATLSIPQRPREFQQQEDIIKKLDQFAGQTSFGVLIRKQGLIDQINQMNIVHLASPQVQEIYALYQTNFNVLNFSHMMEKIVSLMTEINYTSYIPILKVYLIQNAIQNISKIYSVIKVENFMKILQISDRKQAIQTLLQCSQQQMIQCKLNQQQDIILMKAAEGETNSILNVANQVVNLALGAKQINEYLSKDERALVQAKNLESYRLEIEQMYKNAPETVRQRLKQISDIRKANQKIGTNVMTKLEQEAQN